MPEVGYAQYFGASFPDEVDVRTGVAYTNGLVNYVGTLEPGATGIVSGGALTYDQIRRELGRFLGIGTDFSKWSDENAQAVSDIILRGARRFYFPDLAFLPEDPSYHFHKWTFLQRELSVRLVDDETFHSLPTDFVSFAGRPSIVNSSYPLEEVPESELRDLANAEDGTGDPRYYSIKRTAYGQSLAYRIGLFPAPTGSKTLDGWYVYEPPEISEFQEPVVPVDHAETFLEALFTMADEMLNYETATEGRHLERFKSLIAASIARDKMIGGN